MNYLLSLCAAFGFLVLSTMAISYVFDRTMIDAAVIYLLVWVTFYDLRVIHHAMKMYERKRKSAMSKSQQSS